MGDNYTMLRVEDISFDTENPRIKMALEKYGDHLNAERIHFALRSATDNGGTGTSSYNSLRDSIRATKGIVSPITVVKRDDGYVCIDGNTRLAIYKQFIRDGIQGNWPEIKAVVLSNASQQDIETVRVSAHLIGSRAWPAYEKARYLHYLRNEQFMDYNEMIALCGGNKVEIERHIDAYHDMNEYYRDIVDDDTAFKIDRFSGFVELQKPKVKEAIYQAGLELRDFGEWIRDGKIYRLDTVRNLPEVLQDEEARNIFLDGGPKSIEEAIRFLEQKRAKAQPNRQADKTTLEKASLYQLAEVLAQRIDDLPYSELQTLQNRGQDETIRQINNLETLSGRLKSLLEDVAE